jgi:FAD/FMN-containing dehydrogenase
MIDLDALAQTLRGPVIRPGDAMYEGARRTRNAMLDRHPVAIARPVDALDVATAIRWAAEADLPISVRGGGHSVAGHSVGDGALMLDLGNLRTVSVDPVARTADVGGGALLEDLDRATVAFGLAAPSGTFADTGIGGLVLGGGINYLLGSRGFACDALVGAELVIADGTIVEVDAEREPELLWALRGGGGNFGVVTRFRLSLGPLTRVYGGSMSFTGPTTRELINLTIEVIDSAPDELMLAAAVGKASTGDPFFELFGAWTGLPALGESLFAPFRGRPDLVADEMREIDYLDLQLLAERGGPRFRQYWKSVFVKSMEPGLVEAIATARDAVPPTSFILIEPIHGQASRIPDESAAFGARAAAANVAAIAVWEDPADDEANVRWARESVASWAPYSLRGGGYLNYSAADETVDRVQQAFGAERYARLRAVKRRCDPDNRFRFNANIPPA